MIEKIEVKIPGQNITVSAYYRQSGERWLVCLHGIQTNKALFSSLLETPNFNEYSFLCPDFIGFGNSEKPDNFTYDLQEQLKIILVLLDHLNIDYMSVIGHSLGGMVGTMMLNDLSDRIASFCSIEGNLELADCTASKDAADLSFDEFENRFYPDLIRSLENSSEPSAALRLSALNKTPAHVFYKTSKSIVEHSKSGRLFDRFSHTKVPRLLMFGENSTFTSRPSGKNVKTAQINNAGHFIPLDNPVQFEKILLSFLIKG